MIFTTRVAKAMQSTATAITVFISILITPFLRRYWAVTRPQHWCTEVESLWATTIEKQFDDFRRVVKAKQKRGASLLPLKLYLIGLSGANRMSK